MCKSDCKRYGSTTIFMCAAFLWMFFFGGLTPVACEAGIVESTTSAAVASELPSDQQGFKGSIQTMQPNTTVDVRMQAPGEVHASSNALSQPDILSSTKDFPPTEPAAYWWWLLILYMFYIMAAVCDEYLVPAVDIMCEQYKIPEDVAGATLMAFACNGPETLTNFCAIFLTHSAVGMGTIVGSAVFNVMVIVAFCPLVTSTGALVIPKRTFLRDASFSALSILIVWWALPHIDLLRASVLLGMSVVYALVVAKSDAWFGSTVNSEKLVELQQKLNDDQNNDQSRVSVDDPEDDSKTRSASLQRTNSTPAPGTWANFSLARKQSWPLEKVTRTQRTRSRLQIKVSLIEAYGMGPQDRGDLWCKTLPDVGLEPHTNFPEFDADTSFSSKVLGWCLFILTAPTDWLLWFTIPDVKVQEKKNRYLSAFFLSMLWLSSTSFVVCVGSDAINRYWYIPQSFLGLTLVSIGTSFPNLWASIITARQGRGPIAVSNALGSNVQNIFLVLAGPIWLYVVMYGTYTMGGDDIFSSIVWMGITLLVCVTSTALNDFQLTTRWGIFYIVLYIVYVVQTTLSE